MSETIAEVNGTVEVLDKVQEMGGNLAAKFEVVFGQLAEKIGQGAEYFWPIFVKQQVVEAAAGLSILAIIVFAMCIILLLIKKLHPISKEEPSDWCPATFAMIASAVVLVVCIISFAVNLSNYEMILTGFINPEYAAIEDAVEMVKGL